MASRAVSRNLWTTLMEVTTKTLRQKLKDCGPGHVPRRRPREVSPGRRRGRDGRRPRLACPAPRDHGPAFEETSYHVEREKAGRGAEVSGSLAAHERLVGGREADCARAGHAALARRRALGAPQPPTGLLGSERVSRRAAGSERGPRSARAGAKAHAPPTLHRKATRSPRRSLSSGFAGTNGSTPVVSARRKPSDGHRAGRPEGASWRRRTSF